MVQRGDMTSPKSAFIAQWAPAIAGKTGTLTDAVICKGTPDFVDQEPTLGTRIPKLDIQILGKIEVLIDGSARELHLEGFLCGILTDRSDHRRFDGTSLHFSLPIFLGWILDGLVLALPDRSTGIIVLFPSDRNPQNVPATTTCRNLKMRDRER